MPRTKQIPHKQKKILKKHRNQQPYQPQQPQQITQQPLPIPNHEITAEQLRKKLARQALSKIIPQKESIKEDDFFLVDREQVKKTDQNHEEIAEQINQEHLRKQNRLFQDLSEQYSNINIGQPIEYKGHTLCITSFEVTPQSIYSCSKDKSIIKWDRQTKKKQFISLGKDHNSHISDILSLSLHSNQNVLATAGDDCSIKLWDTRSCTIIDTLRGHKHTINGVKFGPQSNNLCSVSSDLTFKHWDFSQRGLIGTFYEHNSEILDIDYINSNDFLTSGYDKQVIAWKTQKQTKIVFKGHNYAIDRVRSINIQRFVTGCQDGSIYLWHTRRTKPVFKCADAHSKGWISALDSIKQSNIFASGGVDRVVKLWAIEGECSGIRCLQEFPVNGIITDLVLRQNFLAVAECDELRLGRWITDKCRNKVKIFPFIRDVSN